MKVVRKSEHCKLYQEQIVETDKTLNAFGICPKCLWDIADHDHASQGDFISYCPTISCISFVHRIFSVLVFCSLLMNII